MTTVLRLAAAVKQLQATYVAKAKARRFTTGINQFSLTAFSSLNAAGRHTVASNQSRSTGESRIRRIVTDEVLADQLQNLLIREVLGSRTGYWYCSLDHSQFGPFCIAILAVSNRAGRAIPIWCQVNLSEAALIGPLLHALEALFRLLQECAPALKLVLVMDRWFASDKLFQLFSAYGAYFIARTKSDKLIQLPWDPSWWKTPVKQISLLETVITYRTHKLRLVRSELRPGMKDPEPWFLLTNLPPEITRTMVLHRYAERFEIEEAFKDSKWLNRLEWQQIKKSEVIRCLLLFVFLGWWLAWKYIAPPLMKQQRHAKTHPKKKLSWYRLAWEDLQRLLRRPLLESGGYACE